MAMHVGSIFILNFRAHVLKHKAHSSLMRFQPRWAYIYWVGLVAELGLIWRSRWAVLYQIISPCGFVMSWYKPRKRRNKSGRTMDGPNGRWKVFMQVSFEFIVMLFLRANCIDLYALQIFSCLVLPLRMKFAERPSSSSAVESSPSTKSMANRVG